MTTVDIEARLQFACKLVQQCAVLTRKIQSQEVSSIQKTDLSPVTIADFAVQALLTAALHAEFPRDSFLAEESADDLRTHARLLEQVWGWIEWCRPTFVQNQLETPSSEEELLSLIDRGGKNHQSGQGPVWVFDPIDGTAAFMRGQQYAINCAFLLDGREELGIIGCPMLPIDSSRVKEDEVDLNGLGLMIYASRGHGTHVRAMQNSNILLPATNLKRHGDAATLSELVWSDCSSYTSTILPLHQEVARNLKLSWPGVDLFSSLMKYASLGLGHSSVCIRIFRFDSWRSNVWDHAGGVLIFEEDGGRVTDLDGKEIDFSLGRKMAANRGLVCAPSSVHKTVLETVQSVIRSEHIPWSKEHDVRPGSDS